MKDLETTFIKNQSLVFNELKNEYLTRKAKARNVRRIITKSFDELKERSNQLFTNADFNIQDKNFKIIDLMDEDVNLSLNGALILASDTKPKVEKKKVTITISTLRALQEFNQFLRNEEDELSTPQEANILPIKNTEVTVRRQALAIHYLLKNSKYRDDNYSEKARFTQFLTGRETNVLKIKDTNIKKIIDNLFPSSEKQLIKDLQFVREYFEKLGIQSIIDEINKEISNRE